MPNRLLSRAIGNLLGGVSQQPENVRFLNMAEESINAFPSIAEGLDKRPGSQYVAVGYAPGAVGNTVQVFSHVVNRDSGEKYVILIYRDSTAAVTWTARAFNALTGASVPIYGDTAGGGVGTVLNDYLLPAAAEEQVTDERLHLRMMTAGDTTFLLNRRRICLMESTLSDAQENQALIVVRAGVYGQKYAVELDGETFQVNYSDVQAGIQDGLTPDGSVALHSRYIGPDVILNRLLTDIGGPDVLVAQIDENTWRVRIRNSTGGVFRLKFAEFTTGAWVEHATGDITYSAAAAGATLAGNIDAALEAVYPGAAVFTVAVGPDYEVGINETFDIDVTGANAAQFVVTLNSLTGTGGDFSYQRASNVAFIQKPLDAAFEIQPADANYTQLLETIRWDVEDFAILPLIAPDEFKVRISGDNKDGADDYYVKHISDNADFGLGHWEETVGWAVKTSVDAATMPHVFRSYVKSAVGTHPGALAVGDPYFVLELATWDDRAAGDDETSPIPAIFDRRLDALGFHRGRLMLMSGENVLASEAGNPFNLFRVSVASLLDTDRIDLTSQIKDASDFRAMVEHNERAVLFTDQSQVVLDSGGATLSPGSAGLNVAGSSVTDPDGGPVTAGPFIFAPFRRGSVVGSAWAGHSGVYQMFDARGGDRLRLESVDITEQCPRYIHGRVVQMAASTTENLLALVTDDRDFIYLYRWHDTGDGRRIQSAWQKIRLATSYAETTPPRIVSIAFVESTLFITTFRDSDGMGVVIERIEFAPGAKDDDFWSKILLDNRIKSTHADVLSIVFAAGDTTVTFDPGTWKRRGDGATGIVYAVLADIAGQAGGATYTSNAPAGGGGGTAVVVFPGVDLTAKTFYIGQKFTMRHTLSPVYSEARSWPEGTTMALVEGRTRVARAWLDVAAAASLKCELAHQTVGGTTKTREFLHTTGAGLDIVPFAGAKSIPIDCVNDDYALTLINDSPWGSRLNGIAYEVNYHARSRRVG